jgi:hypothetical protein
MNKPTIIVKALVEYVLYTLLKKDFRIVAYDANSNYDINYSLVLVDLYDKDNWWQVLYQDGFRLVIDNLHEPHNLHRRYFPTVDKHYVLNNANWFWYEQCLIDNENYRYTPVKTYKKITLMPIGNIKSHRTKLYEAMKPYLHNCIYSYTGKGIHLPDDQADGHSWTRWANMAWYNDTHFSLVAETWTDHVPVSEYDQFGIDRYSGPYPFITEKTMKPLCYQHPFMVYGQTNTLARLHLLGFETFENLFDESYDQIDNSDINKPDLKLAKIIDNIKNFVQHPYDKLTVDKIEHNYQRFFDKNLVNQRIEVEIIQPLLNYVNE